MPQRRDAQHDYGIIAGPSRRLYLAGPVLSHYQLKDSIHYSLILFQRPLLSRSYVKQATVA